MMLEVVTMKMKGKCLCYIVKALCLGPLLNYD
jgi:hypothetical protein